MLDSTAAPLQESDLFIVGIEYININCPQFINIIATWIILWFWSFDLSAPQDQNLSLHHLCGLPT